MRRGAAYGEINRNAPNRPRPFSASAAAPFGSEYRPPFVVKGPEKTKIVRWGEYKSHRGTHATKFEMNDFRKKLVKRAFAILDSDGSGIVDLDDIRKRYNAKMHPDVIRGVKSEDDILRGLIRNFEEGSDQQDGCITLAEFENYYRKVGENIDDEYFALMIMSAWRMDSAENTQKNALRDRAQAVQISDTDKRVITAVQRLCATMTVDNALKALTYLNDVIRGRHGTVKLVKLGALELLISMTHVDDDVVKRTCGDVFVAIAEDSAAVSIIDRALKTRVIDEALSPMEAGFDRVCRQKAGRAKDLFKRG